MLLYLYLLFCRVIELVFVRSGEALLDALIYPQSLHPRQQLLREGLGILHPAHDVHNHLGVSLALVLCKWNAQIRHRPQYGHQGLKIKVIWSKLVYL